MGTSQSADELVYEDKKNPERFHFAGTTEDGRYAFLIISDQGTGKKGNSLYFRDLTSADKKFIPIISEITDDDFSPVDNVDGKFLIQTNRNAPNGKIVLYDPKNSSWSDVIPEQPNVIDFAGTVGGKIIVSYLKDVASHIYVYNLSGKLENEINLPGVGAALGFAGNDNDTNLFFAFTSPIYPSTIFRYDISSQETKVYRAPQLPGFNPENYDTKQVFYISKDGTRVPMFVTHKKGSGARR